MNTVYYSFLISTSLPICFLAYILHELSNDRRYFELLIISIGYFLASFVYLPFIFIPGDTIIIISYKYATSLELIVYSFVMMFIYKSITKKQVKRSLLYSVLIFATIISITSLDIFIIKSSLNNYNNLSTIGVLFIFLELLIIISFFSKKINSEMRIIIIKCVAVLLLVFLVEIGLKFISNIENTKKFSITLNIISIIFLMKQIYREIYISKRRFDIHIAQIGSNMDGIFKIYKISEKEKEVAILIKKGKSNQKIADELFMSIHTVKSHVSSIYKKFDINKRMELIKILNQYKS